MHSTKWERVNMNLEVTQEIQEISIPDLNLESNLSSRSSDQCERLSRMRRNTNISSREEATILC